MEGKNNKRRAFFISVVLLLIVCGTAIGLATIGTASTDEPPRITVKSKNTDIFWVVGKNEWNGNAYDRLDNFQIQQERIFNRDMPYVKNGEEITITIDGSVPDTVTLTEHILNEDSSYKYNVPGMTYDISFGRNSRKATFTVKSNYATLFSSYSGDYKRGNTIKGYRLVCAWGSNECEYGFVIWGDAAITMDIATDALEHDNEADGDETWRLNPEEVASRYATQVLNFQGTTAVYRNDGSEYARVIFTKESCSEIHIDLYQPERKGDGGIWEVDCWFDENSKMYQVRDLTSLPPLFHNDDNVPIGVRKAVRNAVVDEWTDVFSRYYQVLGFYAVNVNYIETDNSAEIKFILTLVTQNFYKDPDTVGYVKEAKEKGTTGYQRLYEEYNMPRTGNIDMMVTMSLTASGEVERDSIQIYSNISPHGEEYVPTKAEDFIINIG